MRCVDFESLWAAAEEGRLGSEDRERVRDHLAGCDACGRLVAGMEGLEHQLEDLADRTVEVPAYLKPRILARLDQARPPKRWSVFGWFNGRRVLAVGLVSVAFFVGLLARELHLLNAWLQQATVEPVVFELSAPDADSVRLVGDFNDWGRSVLPVEVTRHDGKWVFSLRLDPGRYQYSFVVDGKKWLPDPGAPGIIPDGFGGRNSVLYVSDTPSNRPRSL